MPWRLGFHVILTVSHVNVLHQITFTVLVSHNGKFSSTLGLFTFIKTLTPQLFTFCDFLPGLQEVVGTHYLEIV